MRVWSAWRPATKPSPWTCSYEGSLGHPAHVPSSGATAPSAKKRCGRSSWLWKSSVNHGLPVANEERPCRRACRKTESKGVSGSRWSP